MDCESPTPTQLAYSDGWKQGLADGKSAARAREALDTPEGVLTAMEGIAKAQTHFSFKGQFGWKCEDSLRVIFMPASRQFVYFNMEADNEDILHDEVLALIGKQMGGKTDA